jgi:hypothetical protein
MGWDCGIKKIGESDIHLHVAMSHDLIYLVFYG